MNKSLILWCIIGMVLSVIAVILSYNQGVKIMFSLLCGFLLGFMIARIKEGDENGKFFDKGKG